MKYNNYIFKFFNVLGIHKYAFLLILSSCSTSYNVKHSFNSTEVIIRKLFDEYLDNLTKFIILSKSKLIEELIGAEGWLTRMRPEKVMEREALIAENLNKQMKFRAMPRQIYVI